MTTIPQIRARRALRRPAMHALLAAGAAVWLLAACSIPRSDYAAASTSTVAVPPACVQSLANKGFAPADRAAMRQPGSVWWCARVINMPGGRFLAAMGWYHEWICTPDGEAGADLAGADSVRGSWPSSWSAFVTPMEITDHTGAAARPGTYAKRIATVDYDAVRGRMKTGARTAAMFPFSNCSKWAHRTLRDSRAPRH